MISFPSISSWSSTTTINVDSSDMRIGGSTIGSNDSRLLHLKTIANLWRRTETNIFLLNTSGARTPFTAGKTTTLLLLLLLGSFGMEGRAACGCGGSEYWWDWRARKSSINWPEKCTKMVRQKKAQYFIHGKQNHNEWFPPYSPYCGWCCRGTWPWEWRGSARFCWFSPSITGWETWNWELTSWAPLALLAEYAGGGADGTFRNATEDVLGSIRPIMFMTRSSWSICTSANEKLETSRFRAENEAHYASVLSTIFGFVWFLEKVKKKRIFRIQDHRYECVKRES